MPAPTDVTERFAALDENEKLNLQDYNFEHFRCKHLAQDARATITKRGIQPGEMAPDFELPRTGGGSLRLSDLRGNPVVLHFGSLT